MRSSGCGATHLLLATAACIALACATSKPVAEISVDDGFFELSEPQQAAWIGYGLALRAWHDFEYAKRHPGEPFRNTLEG